MKTIDELFNKYAKIVDLSGSGCPRQDFLEEVGVMLWNGDSKTIQGAAELLVRREFWWKNATEQQKRRGLPF